MDQHGKPMINYEDRCASVDVSKRIVATAYMPKRGEDRGFVNQLMHGRDFRRIGPHAITNYDQGSKMPMSHGNDST